MTHFGIPEIDQQLAGVMKLVDQMSDIQAQMDELSGTASTDDQLISVTVDSRGQVSDLHIEPKAMRMASEDLAQAIRQTIVGAQEDLQTKLNDVFQTVGETSGLDVNKILSSPSSLKESAEDVGRVVRGEQSMDDIRAAIAEMNAKMTGYRG